MLECYYGGSEAGDADDTGSALAVAGPGAPVQKRTRYERILNLMSVFLETV